MKISRIHISNFRSITQAEFSTSSMNIFVGQNNCGKTNFFEALEFFFNGLGRGGSLSDVHHKRDTTKEIVVEVEFTGALAGAEQMQKAANKTKIQKALDGSDTVVFKRTSTDPKARTMYVRGLMVEPGTGFDAALNEFLPKFEYIHTKQYYDAVAKYTKTSPIGIMLSGVLATVLQKNRQYQAFQQKFADLFEAKDSQVRTEFVTIGNKVKIYLEKQFPDTTKVTFEVTPPAFDDLLKNFETTIDDGVETTAEEKGDGMQRALMLAIIQVYSDYRKENEDLGKSFLFFIDEAELHLHPAAQRKLKSLLLELSQTGDQVFLNTHSSVLVADDAVDQKIFKVEKDNGETDIVEAVSADKPYITFELLGGSPSDLLLPRNFLVVEGASEYEFFTRLIKRLYGDRPRIQIIKAQGDIDQAQRSINSIEKVFTPLGTSIYRNKVIILIDQPHPDRRAGVTAFVNANAHLRANGQFFELPARDIEQCYPNQTDPVRGNWKKTQVEVDAMDSRKKTQLAKHVGNTIAQVQFEAEMPDCYKALTECWAKAFV
ncbi:MAG: AAA family ATPase [Flavobacteriales bacterium]|nr:AAA family ATPase [Flavobacteriales bacterium]